jgi:hypothetical protein
VRVCGGGYFLGCRAREQAYAVACSFITMMSLLNVSPSCLQWKSVSAAQVRIKHEYLTITNRGSIA